MHFESTVCGDVDVCVSSWYSSTYRLSWDRRGQRSEVEYYSTQMLVSLVAPMALPITARPPEPPLGRLS